MKSQAQYVKKGCVLHSEIITTVKLTKMRASDSPVLLDVESNNFQDGSCSC